MLKPTKTCSATRLHQPFVMEGQGPSRIILGGVFSITQGEGAFLGKVQNVVHWHKMYEVCFMINYNLCEYCIFGILLLYCTHNNLLSIIGPFLVQESKYP